MKHSIWSHWAQLAGALVVVCLLVGGAFEPSAYAASHSTARWFINTVFPNWTCVDPKVLSWGDCYSDEPAAFGADCSTTPLRCYAFSTTYPGQGVASNNRIFFILNEWAALDGPGSATPGDTPMLWDAPATYNGARGASGLRYLGDLVPKTGGHYGGFSLLKRPEDGTWFGFIEYRPTTDANHVPPPYGSTVGTSAADDHAFIYMQRGNPYDWRGGWNGLPGPSKGQFFEDLGGTAAQVFHYDIQTISSTGFVLLDEENGWEIHGYFTWNWKSPWQSNYTPIKIDPDAKTFRLKDSVTGWSNPYPFGSAFPTTINPFSNGPNAGWGLFRDYWTGQEYAFRPAELFVTGSVNDPPPDCPDLNVFATNLAQGQRNLLLTARSATVDSAMGTVGTFSFWGSGSHWVPGHYRQSLVHVAGGSWSFGTFSYQNSGDLAVCREELIGWNPNSGGAIVVHDFSP